MPLVGMCQEKIDCFGGEFHFLSNFYPAYVLYEGIVWPSSEHAYQAMKTTDENQRLNISILDTPGEAKKMGKAVKMRVDWDDVKLDIMEEIVRAKFTQNPQLQTMLLYTEDLEIIEGNTWGDTFWGVCDGVGENHLGKILMKIRDEIKEDAGSIKV
jgi:ribA/ribD-fused uncharacterized protein